jgi:hypothetical protein
MDPIAVAGLVVGTKGAAAAVAAAIYARASPTKADLQRVEDNTAESARHIDAVRKQLAEQERRDGHIGRAQRVSISVSANDRASQLLNHWAAMVASTNAEKLPSSSCLQGDNLEATTSGS